MNNHSEACMPEEFSSEEWWRLNAALAHYDVHVAAEGEIVTAFAHLVCQAMASAAIQVLTRDQIRGLLKDQFGDSWHVGQINSAIKELVQAGFVERIPSKEGPRYTVKEEFRRESINEQNETEKLRDLVLEEWVSEILKKNSELKDEECKLIVRDLIDFIVDVFDRYGAEGAALLYYGEKRKEEFIAVLERDDIPSLPSRGNITSMRNNELIGFFRNSKGERSRFIGQFLRSSFLKSAISIDPKFSGIVSNLFKGATVVLDTNVLFSIFGLEGVFEDEVAQAAIKFTKELGIKIIVHRVSLREFRGSLERQGNRIKSVVMPSQELAGAIDKSIILEGPIGAYYKRYASSGISWEDWVQPFLAIEARLEDMGIEITDMYQDAIEKSKELEMETSRIYEVSHEYVEGTTGGHLLNIEICRHDAFLKLFVDRLRKGKPEEFVKAGTWCVTLDSKLPRYERIERDRLRGIPVFVMIEQWLQFVGPIAPKEGDWDALARSLLLSPYLMVTIPSAPSTERIHKAATRIAEYKNFSPELATRVLLNTRLQESIKRIDEAELDNKVGAVIEEALLEEYYEQDKQLNLIVVEREELKKEVGETKIIVQKQRVLQETMREEFKRFKKSNNVFFAVLIAAVLLLVGLSLNWTVLKPLPFTLAIIGMLIGIISIAGFIKNWQLAWRIFLTVATVASLATAILTFRMM